MGRRLTRSSRLELYLSTGPWSCLVWQSRRAPRGTASCIGLPHPFPLEWVVGAVFCVVPLWRLVVQVAEGCLARSAPERLGIAWPCDHFGPGWWSVVPLWRFVVRVAEGPPRPQRAGAPWDCMALRPLWSGLVERELTREVRRAYSVGPPVSPAPSALAFGTC
jgi:hypothetical protein